MAKLVTKTMLKSIPKLYATEKIKLEDKIIYAKVFGGPMTVYIAEASDIQPNGDVEFFTYTHISGRGGEWGYVTLHQLESIKVPPFGLGLERDKYFNKTKFGVIKSKNFIY